MNMAKGKIPYPLLLMKSSSTIDDVNFLFKSYNNLTYPLIFLGRMNSLEK